MSYDMHVNVFGWDKIYSGAYMYKHLLQKSSTMYDIAFPLFVVHSKQDHTTIAQV